MTDLKFDVAVIGCGPAGIAAASVSAELGARVVVVDESPRPGGQIWRHVSRNTLPRVARAWLHRLDRSGAKGISGFTVTAIERTVNDRPFILIIAPASASNGAAAKTLVADSIIIATGARERFIPFPGWTLPGVFGVGGGQALLKAGASMQGKRVVVAGSGPLLLPVAAAMSHAGARVTHVLEQARRADVARFALDLWRTPSRVVQAASYRAQSIGARFMTGSWVTEAHGDERVRGVMTNSGESIECDVLCAGYGLVPSLEIATLVGCDIRNGAVDVDNALRTSVPSVLAAGESTGVAGVDAALAEGELAAHTAVSKPLSSKLQHGIARERAFAAKMDAAFALRDALKKIARADTVVCRCEDVSAGAIARCASMREAKLHTRAGMGPCQARVCGPAMQFLYGWTDTSVRPPVLPTTISSLLTDTTAAAGGKQ